MKPSDGARQLDAQLDAIQTGDKKTAGDLTGGQVDIVTISIPQARWNVKK